MLDKHGYIKLIDFGHAKEGITDETKTYSLLGTPEYISPEVLMKEGYDKSIDFWSLGIILYEMVNGISPFFNESKINIYKNILQEKLVMKSFFSSELCALLERLLEKNVIYSQIKISRLKECAISGK